MTSLFKPPSFTTDRNEKVLELLSQAKQVGQVRSMVTKEEQSSMKDLAQAIEKSSDLQPARYPLEGIHNLVYVQYGTNRIFRESKKLVRVMETAKLFVLEQALNLCCKRVARNMP
jgi:hypothetical protein